MEEQLKILKAGLKGDLFTDEVTRLLYATDGSAYREVPIAVARPACKEDIISLVRFAYEQNTSLIPRGAGTSLAGQVVGGGIVVDVSKYLNRILDLNEAEKWVRVEPGVVLGELNLFLARHNLIFGPETSTANRCCLGGMLGNNSCGLHSIIYGSVRDHIMEVETVLSDGTEVLFSELSTDEFMEKCCSDPLLPETRIYRFINDELSRDEIRKEILENFPDPRIKRRNHGYAIDSLLDSDPFMSNGKKINLSRLLAGSEGTLAFTTAMKLNLIDLPSGKKGLICGHFSSMQEALKANIIALRFAPASIELIDDYIINCTKDNPEQTRNRFFISGEPKIILIIEFIGGSIAELTEKAHGLRIALEKEHLGFHFPFYTEVEDMNRIWDLRKAGLGVLLNIPGEKRSVQVIEDTAVLPERYPEYFDDFERVLQRHDLTCAYYGHIATGELHFSPLLNLRDPADIEKYRSIAGEVAALVKKHRGSLSGEHGDGRLRGEFIPFMLGEKNYSLLKELKKCWDPRGIFNPGKITDTPSLTDNLRYETGLRPAAIDTTFRYPEKGGILFAVEKCSGSGDCRKMQEMGGTMCPTFMATGEEDKSTRGRANLLREFLTRSPGKNRFDHRELYQIMDLCISCKACRSECPSNVDMAAFKAEFLQHYYESNVVPLRSFLIAWLPRINRFGTLIRPVTNFVSSSSLFKLLLGFSLKRNIPSISGITLRKWARRHRQREENRARNGKVYLFADEFSNFNDSDIGIKSILLLEKLGYEVIIPGHLESGRTLISKGLLRAARKIATVNIQKLSPIISKNTPLIGIEPSAILSFRDEYPAITVGDCHSEALRIADHTYLLDEFLCREADRGKITPGMFTDRHADILLHGHCQQKSVASTASTVRALSLPANYSVTEIKSGCCGMAGAFGYEKEHYELSMKIGELALFPAVRNAKSETIIAATGTSCRCQIADGTGKKALHPAEILYEALK